jgi:hypothetical protein
MRTSVVTIHNFCARWDGATHTYEQTDPNLIIKIRGNGNKKKDINKDWFWLILYAARKGNALLFDWDFFWLIPYARSGPIFQSPTPIMVESMANNYGISNLSRDGIDFGVKSKIKRCIESGFTTNSNLILSQIKNKCRWFSTNFILS